MNLIKANIENLTSLWQLAGTKLNAFYLEKELSYCRVNNSEWPNRLWFHKKVNETHLKQARDILSESKIEMKISYWNIFEENTDNLFRKYGFVKSSEQIGMSLKLTKKHEVDRPITLRRVTDKSNAVLWSDLFRKAFNYKISHELVLLSLNDVEYFIAYHKGQPVGTCILYSRSNKIIGIHSLGITPEMRRKGFAEEIMKHILSNSIEHGFKYTTLQASEMAKRMYEKLGFSTQFMMYNYQINN